MSVATPSPPLCLPHEALSGVLVEPVAVLRGHSQRVWCVAWHPTEEVLASASGDATVKLWSRRKHGGPPEEAYMGTKEKEVWECIGTLEGEHTRTIRHVSWSPSGEYLACASFDHTATVWRRSSHNSHVMEYEVEGVLDGQESEIKCVEWATDSTLATCSRDHTVWVWDRLDEGEYECGGVLTGHTQDVKHCIWSMPLEGSGRPMVVSCGYDNTIRVWSDESYRQDDWHCVQTIGPPHHTGTVWATAFQPLEVSLDAAHRAAQEGAALPQPLLCSCSDDLSVCFWKRGAPSGAPPSDDWQLQSQSRSFECVACLSGFSERSIYSVAWAPVPSAVVACASGDNSIALLGLSEDSEGVHVQVIARVPDAHDSDVNCVSFSHSGSLSCSDCDGAAGNKRAGVLLASAGDDDTVRLWRVSCA